MSYIHTNKCLLPTLTYCHVLELLFQLGLLLRQGFLCCTLFRLFGVLLGPVATLLLGGCT